MCGYQRPQHANVLLNHDRCRPVHRSGNAHTTRAVLPALAPLRADPGLLARSAGHYLQRATCVQHFSVPAHRFRGTRPTGPLMGKHDRKTLPPPRSLTSCRITTQQTTPT